ncbi:MAG: M15 family metallopeptidase [Candidatus Saccharimonadales bacterium]
MRKPKRILLLAVVLLVVIVAGIVILKRSKKPTGQNPSAYADGAIATTNQPTETPKTDFDKSQYSLTDPNSQWVIVNKQRPLPAGYAPNDLVVPSVGLRLAAGNQEMQVRKVTAAAMQAMFGEAKKAGYNLLLASGYRSEDFQKNLYNGYVAQKGQALADTDSARPGHSEHQTGLAFDVGRADRKCEVDPCFGDTAEGQWVATNAHKYGFVVRYPANKQGVTGYIAEPWHLRYVGNDLATEVYQAGLTLEEFFSLPAAPDYN